MEPHLGRALFHLSLQFSRAGGMEEALSSLVQVQVGPNSCPLVGICKGSLRGSTRKKGAVRVAQEIRRCTHSDIAGARLRLCW